MSGENDCLIKEEIGNFNFLQGVECSEFKRKGFLPEKSAFVVELEADASDLWVDELLASSYKISYASCSL